ncbi:unnamed protein product [Rotaria sp. Silwood1]|nr:unnamed protein product [Rotaria sp. Silwood1]
MFDMSSYTDITCDDAIKELYEFEITKQNKRRLDNVRDELNTVIATFALIVEKTKLLTIGREQNLIEQAKRFLDVPNSSIDEIQNIFEQVNQVIPSTSSEMFDMSSCTDITCDDAIKELYECYYNVRDELNTVIATLALIVEPKKLMTIEGEQNLIEQAKRFLDVPNSSIDEIQNIFEQVNQVILSTSSGKN